MARYIDLDKLLNGLEDELKDKNPNDIAYLVFKLFICRLSKEPTVDVVPKSEVERLTAEIETLNEKNAGLALACMCDCMANEDCMGHNEWKAIKSEVAREIFEEIESHFDKKISFYQDFRLRAYSVGNEKEVIYANTMITNLTIHKEDIAELKKKHTEANDEEKS